MVLTLQKIINGKTSIDEMENKAVKDYNNLGK